MTGWLHVVLLILREVVNKVGALAWLSPKIATALKVIRYVGCAGLVISAWLSSRFGTTCSFKQV